MKYIVTTNYITYQHIEIEADSPEQAFDNAMEIDLDDWVLDRIKSGDTDVEVAQ